MHVGYSLSWSFCVETRSLWLLKNRVCSTSVLPTTKRLSEEHEEREDCDESAGDEKEGREQDCTGQVGKGGGLQRQQGDKFSEDQKTTFLK